MELYQISEASTPLTPAPHAAAAAAAHTKRKVYPPAVPDTGNTGNTINLDHHVIVPLLLHLLSPGDRRHLRLASRSLRSLVDSAVTKLTADFSWPSIRPTAWALLTATKAPKSFLCPSLTTVSLKCCSLTAVEAAALAAAPGLTCRLQHLYLDYNRLGDTGLEALTQGTWVKLQSLTLTSNMIGPRGVAALAAGAAAHRWGTSLKELVLKANQLKDEGVATLCSPKCPWGESLQVLDLGFNLLTEVAGEHLAAARLPLTALALSANPRFKDAGARALATSSPDGWCQSLQVLRLDLSRVTVEGVKALIAAPFHDLKVLSVDAQASCSGQWEERAQEMERLIKKSATWRTVREGRFEYNHLVV